MQYKHFPYLFNAMYFIPLKERSHLQEKETVEEHDTAVLHEVKIGGSEKLMIIRKRWSQVWKIALLAGIDLIFSLC